MPTSRPRPLALLGGLALAAAACDEGSTLSQGEVILVLEPDVLDLGRVYVGRPVEATVRARSLGGAPVVYDARFGAGFGEGLEVGPARQRIPPQQSESILVRLDPTAADLRNAQVLFDYGVATATLTVRANVQVPPDCEDGNICTENAFDFELGRCTSRATTDACNDLDACTTRDQCAQAICLGEAISCDDDNVCTDDFCDRETGCVHRLARECDDGNPCTNDFCDPVRGCRSTAAEDGTPCGQSDPCRVASICVGGQCSEVEVPDGTECDDGDTCSTNEQCVDGTCRDPDFPYPDDGEVEWATQVGPLAPGAERNPVIDVDGRIFVGVAEGVVALETCGGIAWENRAIGPPDADSMLLFPGRLVVPYDDRVVELAPASGNALGEVSLLPLLEGRTSTAADLTALDLVIRGAGGLVGSTWVEPETGDPFGLVWELPVDAPAPFVRLDLGPEHAAALAIDRDESLVLLLREGAPDAGAVARERVARLGPDNLPGASWTSSPVETRASGISIDAAGRVLWTAGLRTFTRTGQPARLADAAPDPLRRRSSSAVVDRGRMYFVRDDGAGGAELVAWDEGTTRAAFVEALPGAAAGATPGLDASGNVYVVSDTGRLVSWDFVGNLRFARELPIGAGRIPSGAAAVTSENTTLVVGGGRVFGVQNNAAQSTSAWFRYRRDNFSTGHR